MTYRTLRRAKVKVRCKRSPELRRLYSPRLAHETEVLR